MPDPCPNCGANLDLVGIRHNCRVRDVKLTASANRNVTCPNCETLQARVTLLEAKLVTLQRKNADRVAKHRAKKKAG